LASADGSLCLAQMQGVFMSKMLLKSGEHFLLSLGGFWSWSLGYFRHWRISTCGWGLPSLLHV